MKTEETTLPQDKKVTVLLIDGDPVFGEVMRAVASPLNVDIRHVRSGREGLSELDGHEYAAILVADRLQDMLGVDLVEELRKRRGHPRVLADCVLLTVHPRPGWFVSLMKDVQVAYKGSARQLTQLLVGLGHCERRVSRVYPRVKAAPGAPDVRRRKASVRA